MISIIALLIGILLPSLSSARDVARRLQCGTRIRTLGLSLELYAQDNKAYYPPRVVGPGQRWPVLLSEYYEVPDMLVCPADEFEPGMDDEGNDTSDFDDMLRSYLINGFNDIAVEREGDPGAWNWPNSVVRQAEIPSPGIVIMFGEKRQDVFPHFYMDMLEQNGNDLDVVNHSRHGDASRNQGGSYYAFGDGSSRFLPFPEALSPINQWATVKSYREVAIE
ncbi:hypothetical protein Pan265_09560 [Mucisphaera calidilacus]|uniref:DUF1559 domain-containing protein n=1 Tax=Mucisphaera calidilacus TaxID=2527982 RepID=A0A518BVV8_9BACT|nr:hypothetical protein Pan265_09560 [Mucisphaera calidilacus]